MLSIRGMSKDLRRITDQARAAAEGPSKLARALGGITPQAVSSWDKIPLKRVYQVAEITGIPAHKLRPDVIPAPAPAKGKQVRA
jgi:DNA-binding transcriptional regulator YdaS (Cro superfamily)